MKKSWKFIAYCSLLLTIFSIQSVFSSGRQVRDCQVIIKVKSKNKLNSIAAEYGLTVSDSISQKKTYLLNVPEDRELGEVVELLNADNRVSNAFENSLVGLPEILQISQGFPDENRPVYNLGVEPIDYYAQPSNYSIGLDSAHVISTGAGVTIAVIDNGLAMDHPLIQDANIVFYHDFVSGNSSQNNQPVNTDHGTFVTGIILLTAPECTVIPIRAFDENGVSDQFTLTKSINWAINHGADIINLSFGSSELDTPLLEAYEDASAAGIVMVAASGNDSSDVPLYPASLENVIAVGSVDQYDSISMFSNYGQFLDLTAPGENIYSSLSGEFEWGTWSGTSFAAPFVSGTIAMMLKLKQNFTPDAIADHLRNTATTNLLWGDITTPDIYYGYGILNSFEAVVQLTLGDFDASGERTIQDLDKIVDIASRFGGPDEAPSNGRYDYNVKMRQADVNCDGVVDFEDVSYMSDYIFVHVQLFNPCFNR